MKKNGWDINLGNYDEKKFVSRKAMAEEIEKDTVRVMEHLAKQKKELVEKLEKRKEVLKELLNTHNLDIDRERLNEVDQTISVIKKI